MTLRRLSIELGYQHLLQVGLSAKPPMLSHAAELPGSKFGPNMWSVTFTLGASASRLSAIVPIRQGWQSLLCAFTLGQQAPPSSLPSPRKAFQPALGSSIVSSSAKNFMN